MSAISWVPAVSATVLAAVFCAVLVFEEKSYPDGKAGSKSNDGKDAAKTVAKTDGKADGKAGAKSDAKATISQVEGELRALLGRANAAQGNAQALQKIQVEKATAWKKLNGVGERADRDAAYKLTKDIEALSL